VSVPSLGLGPPRTAPPPLPQASAPPPPQPRGGGHARLRVREWGSPNSDDCRKSLALCLLCGTFFLTLPPPPPPSWLAHSVYSIRCLPLWQTSFHSLFKILWAFAHCGTTLQHPFSSLVALILKKAQFFMFTTDSGMPLPKHIT
jgi:hypothetical protein